MRGKIRFGLLLVLGLLLLAGEWPRSDEGYRLEFHFEGAYSAHYPVLYLHEEEAERSIGPMLAQIPGEANLVATLRSPGGKLQQEWRWRDGAWVRTDKAGR
jgi:hypothetical protein